jgi:hypothetical protein
MIWNKKVCCASLTPLQDELKTLETRDVIEQKKISEHRAAKEAIKTEIDAVKDKITKLESGAPLEPDKPLEYSRQIRRQ